MEPKRDLPLSLPLRGALRTLVGPGASPRPGPAVSTFEGEGGLGGVAPWVREGGWAELRHQQAGVSPAQSPPCSDAWPEAHMAGRCLSLAGPVPGGSWPQRSGTVSPPAAQGPRGLRLLCGFTISACAAPSPQGPWSHEGPL